MTLTWLPDAGVTITEHADAYRWGDFLKNFIVASGAYLCSKGAGNKDLNVANGDAYIKGWKATAASHTKTFTEGDGTWFCYLVNTVSGDNASFDLALYSSEQSDVSDKIYLCTFPISSGVIGTVTDKRYQFQSIDATRVEITSSTAATKTLLSDWRHTTDLSKIDGAKIFDGSIVNAKLTDLTITNAKVSASAAIEASKILISGSTYLSSWRHGTDPTKIDGGYIYNGTITNAMIVAAAGIDWSKITKGPHNDLTTFQGGQSGEYYHLTSTQQSNLTSGTTDGDAQHRHTVAVGKTSLHYQNNYNERNTTSDEGTYVQYVYNQVTGKNGTYFFTIASFRCRNQSTSTNGCYHQIIAYSNCNIDYLVSPIYKDTTDHEGVCWAIGHLTADATAEVRLYFGRCGGTGSVYTNYDHMTTFLLGKTS